MEKSITTDSRCEIVIYHGGGGVTLTILGVYDPTVELTIDECAKLSSALGAIVKKERRQIEYQPAAGSTRFNRLSVGQKFRFVHHGKRVCTKTDSRHYAWGDGSIWSASANAVVFVVE